MRETRRSVSFPGSLLIGLLLLPPAVASANPAGADVVAGNVSMETPDAATLNVYSSGRSVINWRDFSIAADEVTRFIQQSSTDAVLNRVTGPNLSEILGQLLSNGSVFLVNPNGVVVGPNAVIDTASFIASTLNLSDHDFLTGNLSFNGVTGSILNQGVIRTGTGGNIVLIAPDLVNEGLLQADGGSVTLAAGERLQLTDIASPEIQFEVQAPEHTVLQLGELHARSGSVQIFAGTIHQQGLVSADSVGRDDAGNIVLRAGDSVFIGEGSLTTASAADQGNGGTVIVYADNAAHIDGDLRARGGTGGGDGGFVETSGRLWIDINVIPDARAPAGRWGTWLIDPVNITIDNFCEVPCDFNVTNAGTAATSYGPSGTGSAVLDIDTLLLGLTMFDTVMVQTSSDPAGGDEGDLILAAPLDFNGIGQAAGGGIKSLLFLAHDDIFINDDIGDALGEAGDIGSETGLNLTLRANLGGTGGAISFRDSSINLGDGTLTLDGDTFIAETVFWTAKNILAGNVFVNGFDGDGAENFANDHLILSAFDFSFNSLTVDYQGGDGSARADLNLLTDAGATTHGTVGGNTLNLGQASLGILEGAQGDPGVNGLVTVNTLNWTDGGSLSNGGIVTLAVTDAMNLGPGNQNIEGVVLDLRSTANSTWDSATLSGTASTKGFIAPEIRNAGVLTLGGTSTYSGSGSITNTGTLNLGAAGADTDNISLATHLTNDGTTNVLGRSVAFTGFSGGVTNNGVFNIDNGDSGGIPGFTAGFVLNPGTFNLRSGTYHANQHFDTDFGDFPVYGRFNWSGGVLNFLSDPGLTDGAGNSTLRILGAVDHRMTGDATVALGNFTLGAGTLELDDADLTVTAGTFTVNRGTTFLLSDAAGFNPATVNNAGTMRMLGGTMNTGTLNVQGGSLFSTKPAGGLFVLGTDLGTQVTVTNTLNVSGLLEFNVREVGLDFDASTATVNLLSGGRLESEFGTFLLGPIGTWRGTLVADGGIFDLGGRAFVNPVGGNLQFNSVRGQEDIVAGATRVGVCSSCPFPLTNLASLTNRGTMRMIAGAPSFGFAGTLGAPFVNEGTLVVDNLAFLLGSTFTQNRGTTSIRGQGGFFGGIDVFGANININGGTVNVQSGFLGTNGNLNVNGGSFKVGGDGAVVYAATTTLDNSTFAPGSSPGTSTFFGNLVLGPNMTTVIELAGFAQGTSYDFIDVQSGSLTLGGSLLLLPLPGFFPPGGSQFQFAQSDSGVTGAFSQIAFPSTAGIFSVTDNGLVVTATSQGGAGITGTGPSISLIDNGPEGTELIDQGAQERPQTDPEQEGSPWLDEEAGWDQQLMVCQ